MVKPTYACIFERPGDVSPKRSLPPLKRWMASPASNRGSCIIRDDTSEAELNSLVSHSTQVCPAATIWFLQPKHTHCINQHLCNKLALSCSLITPLTKNLWLCYLIPWYFDAYIQEHHDFTMVHVQKHGNVTYLNNSEKRKDYVHCCACSAIRDI